MCRVLVLVALVARGASWTLDSGARIAAAAVRPNGPGVRPNGPGGAGPRSILDLHSAEEWCTAAGLSEGHLLRVYGHLFRRSGAFAADALHRDAGLARETASAMCDAFAGLTSRVVERVASAGGLKLVVELGGGARVETVLVLHDHESSGGKRCTVCVSSQVGCARGCTFCATGTMGLLGNLAGSEILEQVWHARAEAPDGYDVRNVVFMGMGEPLDNYSALLDALRGLTHQALFDLSAKRVTVSTVGAEPEKIRALARDAPSARLRAESQPYSGYGST